MKFGDGLLKFIRTERHKKLSVISIDMVVDTVRRDEMTKEAVKRMKRTGLGDAIGRRKVG
jgi:hypothetical protein